ncbi:MAG TPA: LD-carboxypeptidase [Candidatus Dojkabacteria bacterium]|nr:LD-carboxypeptidase [Candidatus Dojkabacteria bacterium]
MKIGIFATSSPLDRPKKDNDYEYLKSKGFEIFEHPQVREKTNHLAGSINDRVKALEDLLTDKSVDILMAYWGGANTNQLLPYLNYDLFAKYPKPIVGFSDTTALLLAVNKLAKIKTYMGPAGITFDKPSPFEYSFDYFKKLVVDKGEEVLVEDSKEYADDLYFLRKDSDHRILQQNVGRKVFKHGEAEGEVIAGNLQTLLVLAGTKYFPELKGRVLFLEEDENANPAMIHRFLTHLSQCTNLKDLKGICIGRFASQSGFNENDTEEDIYNDIFNGLDIPIIYNLDFGHTDPLFTIPIGGHVEINTEKSLIKFL